jgi:hypothetical protein
VQFKPVARHVAQLDAKRAITGRREDDRRDTVLVQPQVLNDAAEAEAHERKFDNGQSRGRSTGVGLDLGRNLASAAGTRARNRVESPRIRPDLAAPDEHAEGTEPTL